MKTKYFILMIACSLAIFGCKNDDDTLSTFMTTESNIEIVLQDGTEISESGCIDPSLNYAVKITVAQDGNGVLEPTIINYTVNGNTASTTFVNLEPKLIGLTLIEGQNTVQLQNSGISDSVFVFETPEFELVF